MRQASTSLAGRNIAICGGGVMGLASAVHLARQGLGNKVFIIERDSSYKHNSALLSAGGIRHQFSLKENILMSKYSSNFIAEYAKCEASSKQNGINQEEEIAFKPHGYMFLGSSQDSSRVLQANNATQRASGVDWTHLADAKQLSKLFPWLHTEDIALGSYSHKEKGTKEGYFDPWGLMQCMRREALRNNVVFVEGHVEKVYCTSNGNPRIGDPTLTINGMQVKHGNGDKMSDIEEVDGLEALINTTGAWSNTFVDQTICKPNESLLSPAQQQTILDLIPIERRKRCIFYFHCPDKQEFSHPMPPPTTPLTVDPSGVYFRPEGSTRGHFITGVSPEAQEDQECLSDDSLEIIDHHLFEETIWPTLANRVPAFNELKVISSWSGFYDYNPIDMNAIIGYHPSFTNMICSTGFSGHGLQMSPAAGNAVAELLLYKEFREVDLGAFTFDRLEANEPYFESEIV